MNKFDIWIPLFPPSKNKTMWVDDNKRPHYTKEARNFMTEFKAYVSRNYFAELQALDMSREAKYKLDIIVYWPRLTTKTKGAKNYYKIIDATGRLILIEDAFKQVTGVDDLANFEVTIKKREGPQGIRIKYELLSEEEYQRDCVEIEE